MISRFTSSIVNDPLYTEISAPAAVPVRREQFLQSDLHVIQELCGKNAIEEWYRIRRILDSAKPHNFVTAIAINRSGERDASACSLCMTDMRDLPRTQPPCHSEPTARNLSAFIN
jgi:hypothetical protein